MQTTNFTSHFLIAMPGMADPNFSRTLTFICEHNERGALGLVVNRPTDVTLGTLFRQVQIELADEPLAAQHTVFAGGGARLRRRSLHAAGAGQAPADSSPAGAHEGH